MVRLRHRPPLPALAAGLALAVLTACSGGSDPDKPGSDPDKPGGCVTATRAAPAEIALLPRGLSLDSVGTVTRVQHAQGRITAQAVSTKPLDELTVLIQNAVTAAGYRPAGMDTEEDEAEVFFTTGDLAAGQARVRQGGCAGQWNVDLDLIDPAARPPR